MSKTFLVIISICLLQQTLQYGLIADYSGNNFLNNFDFVTYNDPTHGYVDYISQSEAQSLGMVGVQSNGKVYIKSEASKKVLSGQRGRKSIRIQSKRQFFGGIFIYDIDHMPEGCGTWPAFWMVGPNWPNGGEIDIIEGVNNQNFDQTTLHTGPACSQEDVDVSQMSGHWTKGSSSKLATNCYVNAPYQYSNQGCGIAGNYGSYGSSFNQQGGGVYAVDWNTNDHIKVWFFPRKSIPNDIAIRQPNPANWGKPQAYFKIGAQSQCSSNHFAVQNIVINLTFCGDWAGSTFGSMCPNKGSCNSFVANNPQEFNNAYWLINSLRVYSY